MKTKTSHLLENEKLSHILRENASKISLIKDLFPQYTKNFVPYVKSGLQFKTTVIYC